MAIVSANAGIAPICGQCESAINVAMRPSSCPLGFTTAIRAYLSFTLVLFASLNLRAAIGEPMGVAFDSAPGLFPIVDKGVASDLCIDPNDWAGVRRAAGDLQTDIANVSRVRAKVEGALPHRAEALVIIGTAGRSALIDDLIRAGRLDVAAIRGRWESWITQTIDHPFPGVGQALVIAGSDKRGTIYGIYELSQEMGVSPWYWWADVPAKRHAELFHLSGCRIHGPPVVKYRGIFLNDEAPDLTNWVRAKFGMAAESVNPPVPPGVANYNREFYGRIFEVILRLRGNYLWPAMWNNAFNEDDPENAKLADDYGIVMGTSHQEPMLRAQKEWDRRYLKSVGPWNYARSPQLLDDFWRAGIRRNKGLESIVTLGLRGANDTEMAPGGPPANRALLERIVEAQRRILGEEVNPDLRLVPQLWCLYKEVQDYYDAGMRVPDDVTLLWADDNWGNLRRLPTETERRRGGGAGIYYHFDYHGGPRSYQWINTNPIPKIWEQMSLAAKAGADRIWIVNVGHFKGYELPTEFFLNMAWDPGRWTGQNLDEFTQGWATREFGANQAAGISQIEARLTKYNGRRKPEMLSPETYSMVNYHEAQRVVAEFDQLASEAAILGKVLPHGEEAAYCELVRFPVEASALLNRLYFAAARNALFAAQGRASANEEAGAAQSSFQAFEGMRKAFDAAEGGRWAHFMDQPVLGYEGWRDPPADSLQAIKLTTVAPAAAASFGVAVEGSRSAWPGTPESAALPVFDDLNRQSQYIEVFNRGQRPVTFQATASDPWIVLSDTGGAIDRDLRLGVTIDWARAPAGEADGTVAISGAGRAATVTIRTLRLHEKLPKDFHGFVEAQGCVSIDAAHYSRKIDCDPCRWNLIRDYGRTLSGMRAETEGPLDAPAAKFGTTSPRLEYRIYLSAAGAASVTAITAPTLKYVPDRGLRYAISWDDQAPESVDLVPAGYKAQNGNSSWETSVGDNAHLISSIHTFSTDGAHTLKIWMVDPGVVLEKLVVDLGGVKPSYLGPPESCQIGGSDPTLPAAVGGLARGSR